MKRLLLALALVVTVLIGRDAFGQTPAVAPEKAAGQFVEVNGIQMYYEIRGQGEPLVLLHGFSGSGNQLGADYGGFRRGLQANHP